MFYEIRCCELVNEVEMSKVNELVKSILDNGWNGTPILYCSTLGRLVTGSHRLEALKYIEENYDDAYDILEQVEAIDVSDITNNYCEEHGVCFEEIDFSSLGDIFDGTEIEQYKDSLEW